MEEYAGLKGILPPINRLKGKNTLFICTIEKANSLMNSLIEAGRLSEVGMVVADELHMIGDGPRGAIYEMILSKAKFCGKKSNLQIVATTATLENKNVKKRFNNGRIISIRIYREVLIFFEFLK